ncbi:hypothetical protein [Pedobacter sp. N23S346]|uniref:hypothetical protein n=1 Tax=Pedobacter sp. N23S346 TaxID=3402750 RepID=UPI003AC67436
MVQPWSSPEITVPAGTVVPNVTGSATGANANSTLKAQIYVDGELKRERVPQLELHLVRLHLLVYNIKNYASIFFI